MAVETLDQLYRRAGGRRKYNAQRARAATHRRSSVLALIAQGDLTQRAIAAQLHVSPATITRDVQALERLQLLRWAQAAPELRAAGKSVLINLRRRGNRTIGTVEIR